MSESNVNFESLNSLAFSTDVVEHTALKSGPNYTFTVPYYCSQQKAEANGTDFITSCNLDRSAPVIAGGTTPQPVTVLVGPSELLREGLSRILETAKFPILLSAACIHDLLKK